MANLPGLPVAGLRTHLPQEAYKQNDTVGADNLIYSRSIKMRYLGLADAKPEPKKKGR